MAFYIAVIIFHNQHESNHISMVFYIAIMLYVIATCKPLLFLFFFIFENLSKHG